MRLAVPLEYEFADRLKVSNHFGRSDAFAIFEDSKIVQIVANPIRGIRVSLSECRRWKNAGELVDVLRKYKVEALAVKRIGKHMKKFMEEAGFRIIQMDTDLENTLKGLL